MNQAPMAAGRRADSARRRQRVMQALAEASLQADLANAQERNLTSQVEERIEELHAARAANREMMTRINTARRAPG